MMSHVSVAPQHQVANRVAVSDPDRIPNGSQRRFVVSVEVVVQTEERTPAGEFELVKSGELGVSDDKEKAQTDRSREGHVGSADRTGASGPLEDQAIVDETVLLKTLGIACDELAVSDDMLGLLRSVFDSPLLEHQLKAIAEIFGKTVSTNLSSQMEAVAMAVV
ncbi:hypothetical protein D1007_58197 [Hordeum vulgare]|nr:hypothetical protein D1007_58197 [Hordeum vulgare]